MTANGWGAHPDRGADVLMITYRRPSAVELTLPALLETLAVGDRLWLWHNGEHEETLEIVKKYAQDPRVARFHHSRENVKLRAPTMWLWENATGRYLSKVDDDCLESPDWLETLRLAHESNPDLGAVAGWRHYPDEYRPELAERKIVDLAGGHRVMRNLWVQGSGYLVKRGHVVRVGGLPPSGSFAQWCMSLARHGATNGFYFPFLFEDHLDDPRSQHSLIRSDEDLRTSAPLSAVRNDVRTLAEWDAGRRAEAVRLQSASVDLRDYEGWRLLRRKVARRAHDLLTGRRTAW